jgi:MinD-like ATPase involved in chromosome partitioning or flagellar assembly
MSEKPYIIRISSQKGGVGKTTTAVNLAVSLATNGYKTLLVDTDFSNPSVGFHLGLEDVNVGMQSLLMHKTKIQNAIVVHDPSGLHVLPCEINTKMSIATVEQVQYFKGELLKGDYDFIIVDTPPGQLTPGIGDLYDEAVIITTPDLPALQSVIKLATRYDNISLKHTLVVNRVKHKNYEIASKNIEGMYEGKVTAILPESELVPVSIAKHVPAILLDSRCIFSKTLARLSEQYTYKTEKRALKRDRSKRYGFLRTLIRFFTGKY